jgi:hypothetical protein
MFHVKQVALGFLLAHSGCGYHAVHGGGRTDGTGLAVVAAPGWAPGQELNVAAVTSAREELAGEAALGTEAYPRLVVLIVRVDEGATGLSSVAAPGAPDGRQPLARGSAVGVVGRGWVEASPGGARIWDSGDVRRVETYGARTRLGDAVGFREASRAAARELGRALARRALGQPTPRNQAMP